MKKLKSFSLLISAMIVMSGLSAMARTAQEIMSEAYLWLDATQTNTMVYTSDGRIKEWPSCNANGVTAYASSDHSTKIAPTK